MSDIKTTIKGVLKKWIQKHNQSGKSNKRLRMRDIKKKLDENEHYDLISALSKSTDKTKRRIAARLYLAYGIPYSELGIEEGTMTTVFSPLGLRSHLSALLSLQLKEKNERLFYDQYSDTLNKHIDQATSNINIYDYLAINTSLEYYHNAHTNYFYYLERHLSKNKNITYTRVVTLPIEKYREYISKQNAKKLILNDVILSCSVSMYEHFVRCFNQHSTQFNLIVANEPNRPYSYGFIDEKYVISELFQFDGLETVPSMLFINEVVNTTTNTRLSDLLETYQNDFKLFNKKKGRKISKTLFVQSSKDCLQYIENEYYTHTKQESEKAKYSPMEYAEKTKKITKRKNEMKTKLGYCKMYLG